MILDSAMGTRLIAHGVAPGAVVAASLDAPDAVIAAHQEDVAAGAEIVFTNTFALPAQAARDIDAHLQAALACAHAATPKQVWISLGPPGDEKRHAERVLTSVRQALTSAHAMAVILETVQPCDADWVAAAAAAFTAQRFAVSYAAGAQVRDVAGAFAIGVNCSLFDPDDVPAQLRALQSLPRHKARLAKPALGRTDAWLESALSEFDYVGVCCGGTPRHVARLAAARVR